MLVSILVDCCGCVGGVVRRTWYAKSVEPNPSYRSSDYGEDGHDYTSIDLLSGSPNGPHVTSNSGITWSGYRFWWIVVVVLAELLGRLFLLIRGSLPAGLCQRPSACLSVTRRGIPMPCDHGTRIVPAHSRYNQRGL